MAAAAQTNNGTNRRRWIDALCLAIVLAVSLTLNFSQLGSPSIFGDEAIYAVAARNAAVHGEWYPLRYQQQPLVSKPPLAIWASAASFRLFGVDERSDRLPSALAAALLACLVFLYARLVIDRSFATFAAIVFATSPPWLLEHGARAGVTDPLLCLCLIAAVMAYHFFRQSRRMEFAALTAFCLALAGLTKGLFGPLLFLFAAMVYEGVGVLWSGCNRDLSRESEHSSWLKFRYAIRAPASIFLISLCPHLFWLLDTIRRVPGYPSLLYDDLITRVVKGLDDSHLHGADYYAYVLSYACDHWGLLLLPVGLWLAFRRGGDRATLALRLAAVWSCVAVAMVSCSVSKLPWYVYPALPMMAVLIAAAARKIFDLIQSTIWRVAVATIFALLLTSRLAVAWLAIHAPPKVIELQRVAKIVSDDPNIHVYVDIRERRSPWLREWNVYYLDEIESRIEPLPAMIQASSCAIILTDRAVATIGARSVPDSRILRIPTYDSREAPLRVIDMCAGKLGLTIQAASQ